MINKRKKITESTLRSLIRKQVIRILEAEEETKEKEEEPEVEPEPEPESEPEPEEGIDPAIQKVTIEYLKKLKNTGVDLDEDTLVDMISMIIEKFTSSTDSIIGVLKGLKSKLIR